MNPLNGIVHVERPSGPPGACAIFADGKINLDAVCACEGCIREDFEHDRAKQLSLVAKENRAWLMACRELGEGLSHPSAVRERMRNLENQVMSARGNLRAAGDIIETQKHTIRSLEWQASRERETAEKLRDELRRVRRLRARDRKAIRPKRRK